MNENKKKISSLILSILLVLLVFVSGVLVGIGITTYSDKVTQASADELVTSTFESGPIMANPNLTYTYTDSSNAIHNIRYVSVETFDNRFLVTKVDNMLTLQFYFIDSNNFKYYYYNQTFDINGSFPGYGSPENGWDRQVQMVSNTLSTVDRTFYGMSWQDGGVTTEEHVNRYPYSRLTYGVFSFMLDYDVSDIYKVTYESYEMHDNLDLAVNTKALRIRFYDINNYNMFKFEFNCGVVSDNLIRYMNGSVNGSYEQGYQDGYNADKGFNSSIINERIQDAYDNGYEDGYDSTIPLIQQAYSNGFIAGKDFSSNNLLFSDLMFSIGEVPFGVVRSMLNFELLGMNLAGLVTGILTSLLILKLILLLV